MKKFLIALSVAILVVGIPLIVGGEPEYSQEDINAMVLEHEDRIEALEDHVAGLLAENGDLAAEVEAKDAAIQSLQDEVQDLHDEISDLESRLHAIENPPEPTESYPSHYEINGRTHCPNCGVKYLDLVYFGAQGCDECGWP